MATNRLPVNDPSRTYQLQIATTGRPPASFQGDILIGLPDEKEEIKIPLRIDVLESGR